MEPNSIIEKTIIKKSKYSHLRKEKNYIKYTLATAISRFGDGVDAIAFAWLIYKITGSTLLVATLFAVNALPNLIFGMTSGVICKYISEKKIITICDFGRGISVTLISILFVTGNLHTWHLYIITFLNSSFESFRGPAATSIIPKILQRENLENGVALSSSLSKAAELAGLVTASLFIAILGLGGAILIDAVTFIICGLIMITIKLDLTIPNDKVLTIKSCFIDLMEGFKYVKNDKFVLSLCIFACAINALFVPISALQAPYVSEVLHMGSEALSVFSISIIVGMAITSIFMPKLKEKLGGHIIFVIGGTIVGIAYIFLALLGDLPRELRYLGLALNMFLLGSGIIFVNFPIQIAMFKRIPAEYLARSSSIMTSLALCIVPLTAFIIGVISQFIQLKLLFILFGFISTILFILQSFNKQMKELNK